MHENWKGREASGHTRIGTGGSTRLQHVACRRIHACASDEQTVFRRLP